MEAEKVQWEVGGRATTQAAATNACKVIRQAAEALKLNAELLDHSILTGYGKVYSSKGIKDRLKTAKVTNTHALVPEVCTVWYSYSDTLRNWQNCYYN